MEPIDCPASSTVHGSKQRHVLQLMAAIQVAALSAGLALHTRLCLDAFIISQDRQHCACICMLAHVEGPAAHQLTPVFRHLGCCWLS